MRRLPDVMEEWSSYVSEKNVAQPWAMQVMMADVKAERKSMYHQG